MLNVIYNEKFIRDLKQLKGSTLFQKIKNFCFVELNEKKQISEIVNLKKLQGYSNYYRVRIGDYRIGIKITDKTIELMRILHRKEVYKYFP